MRVGHAFCLSGQTLFFRGRFIFVTGMLNHDMQEVDEAKLDWCGRLFRIMIMMKPCNRLIDYEGRHDGEEKDVIVNALIRKYSEDTT